MNSSTEIRSMHRDILKLLEIRGRSTSRLVYEELWMFFKNTGGAAQCLGFLKKHNLVKHTVENKSTLPEWEITEEGRQHLRSHEQTC